MKNRLYCVKLVIINSDHTIIQDIENRKESGLKQLYKAYSDVLFGNIFRITNNHQLSQEILQTTFLKVWNNIDSYDSSKGGLYTWLNRIARNSTLDHVRLKKYKNQQKTDSLDITVYSRNKTFVNANKIDVDKLLSKLEEKNRVVLDKIYLQGYSHSDAAKELDIPLGTVKSRLRIALQILRQEIKNEKNLFFGFLILIVLLLRIELWQ